MLEYRPIFRRKLLLASVVFQDTVVEQRANCAGKIS